MTVQESKNLEIGDRVQFIHDKAKGTVNKIEESKFNVEWDDGKYGGWFIFSESDVAKIKKIDVKNYIVTSPYENERDDPFITEAEATGEAARKYKPTLKHYNSKKYGHGKPAYTVREFLGWTFPPELGGKRYAMTGEKVQYYIEA